MPPMDVPSKSSPRAASVFSPSSKPFKLRPGWTKHLPPFYRQQWLSSYTGIEPLEQYDAWLHGKDITWPRDNEYEDDEEFYQGDEQGGSSDSPAQWVTVLLSRVLGGREKLFDARQPASEQLDAFAERGWPDGPPSTSWVMQRLTEIAEADHAQMLARKRATRWCNDCRSKQVFRAIPPGIPGQTVCPECEYRCERATVDAERAATAAGGSAAEVASAAHAAAATTMPTGVLRAHVDDIIGEATALVGSDDEGWTCPLDSLTKQEVRDEVERRCRLPAGALRGRREDLDKLIREILLFAGNADPSDFNDLDDASDVSDDYEDVEDDLASVATDDTMDAEATDCWD